MKLFLDTSILSAYFDISKPLRQLVTVKWIKNNISTYEIFVSDLIIQEIENNTNQDLKDKMFTLLDSISPVILEIEENILNLAEKYRNQIIKNEINDSIHIATATINKLDAIVSWNFRHIVNLKTMNAIHMINLENHYHTLEIVSIENLGGDSYGNI